MRGFARQAGKQIRRRPFRQAQRPKLPDGVQVGRHTYGYDEDTFKVFTEGARIIVGAFCSISPDVRIVGGGEHVITRASTFPLNALLFDRARGDVLDAVEKGPTVIGNDVWIGLGAVILAGVNVGDGAVIGAGSVVKKNVAPYAVVAGNPARLVRYRFDGDIRKRLLALRWWEWSDEQLRKLQPQFMADMETFIHDMGRTSASAYEPDAPRGAGHLLGNGAGGEQHTEVDEGRDQSARDRADRN
jgi:acetyltransferase-like isoleucine patch superfamily enzyme